MQLPSSFICLLLGLVTCMCSCSRDNDPPVPPKDSQPVDSFPTSWTKAATPNDTTHLIDIFFQNNTTGYAVGQRGEVWKSVDGGLSWSSVFQIPGNSGGYNLAVTANGKVYIVLNAGRSGIYTSADGVSFQYQTVGNTGVAPDVYFIGNDTGYISNGYATVNGVPATGLWETTDGGTHWQLVPVSGTNAGSSTNDFSFYTSSYGYVISGGGVSHTGGQYNHWSAPVHVTASALTSIAAPSEHIAYAADYRGIIYKTMNGGSDFAAIDSLEIPIATAYINLHFLTEQTGYATAVNVLYKTTDGGSSWLPELTSKNSLDEVHFTDAAHGWVCGNKGTILVYRR